MLHCTIYLSSQQNNPAIIRNHSNKRKRKTAELRSSGKNLNPVAALLESSESSESFQPKEQFVSIGQARTEKTICVKCFEARPKNLELLHSREAEKQRSREAENWRSREEKELKKKENA